MEVKEADPNDILTNLFVKSKEITEEGHHYDYKLNYKKVY